MTSSTVVTMRLPKQTLQRVDELAAQKKLSRDDALVEIIEDYTRRQATRERIQQNMERKRQSPQWQKAVQNIERIRGKAKQVRETEFKADLRAALKAVRAEERNHRGQPKG